MLPEFRYHPDPLSTGSVTVSDNLCRCCGQIRGYIYAASVYAVDDLEEAICPWCISNGSAAQKFDATFSDSHPLIQAGVPMSIVNEVTQRTPGYVSWQQECWLACCGDACEFHGDAPREDLQILEQDDLNRLVIDLGCSPDEWQALVKSYEPGGDPAVYKFICRRCRRPRYGADFS